jgi:hypothetical protein
MPKKPGFLPNMWVSAKDFRQKARFLKYNLVRNYSSMPKKPVFLPNMWVSAKDFRQKTRFLTTRASFYLYI